MRYWLENPGESLSQGPERWRSFDLVEGYLIPFQQEGMLRDGSVCVCLCVCVCVLVAQLYLTLCDPMDCSSPGSSVHGILQARILEWVARPFSRAASQLRNGTWVSHIEGRFFTG